VNQDIFGSVGGHVMDVAKTSRNEGTDSKEDDAFNRDYAKRKREIEAQCGHRISEYSAFLLHRGLWKAKNSQK
jgi:hypothetical protein